MINNNKKSGFSLIEVLMSLLILSVVLVVLAPIIVKRVASKNADGVIYQYSDDNIVQEDNICYVWDSDTRRYVSTRDCSRYEFTVPDGVHKVNLTLVAGGGGGGGASQGQIIETILKDGESAEFRMDELKEVIIQRLVAKGEPGEAGTWNEVSGLCAGGTGGASSSMLYDYSIPLREPTFLNVIDNGQNKYLNFATTDIPRVKVEVNYDETNNKESVKLSYLYEAGAQEARISYITYSVGVGEVSCEYKIKRIGAATTTGPDDYIFNVVDSQKGLLGVKVDNKDTLRKMNKNEVIAGGAGGSVFGEFGRGGFGESKLSCENTGGDCSLADDVDLCVPDVENLGRSTFGGKNYGSVKVATQRQGFAGGGGAGGGAIQIKDFKVNPNETYAIYVGKGGAGGAAALNIGDGTIGESGVTTSIYRVENNRETLVYMVTGGRRGTGGRANANGASGDYEPALIANNFNNIKTGSSVGIGNRGVAINMNGRAPENRVLLLNWANQEPYRTLIENGTNNVDTLRGFNNFEFDIGGNRIIQNTPLGNIYSGLYGMSQIVVSDNDGNERNADIARKGGLGGFSGLGTKGGCGAYFVGNPDGRLDLQASNFNFMGINKFAINNSLYNVPDYYDNCTTSTPDGQTANFVQPEPGKSLGAAGAGGGGGGWSLTHGAGKGGDGQDGYVMIEWTK